MLTLIRVLFHLGLLEFPLRKTHWKREAASQISTILLTYEKMVATSKASTHAPLEDRPSDAAASSSSSYSSNWEQRQQQGQQQHPTTRRPIAILEDDAVSVESVD